MNERLNDKFGKFEAHITCDKMYAGTVETVADQNPPWTFSVITGCPILGTGTYCYLSGFDRNSEKLLDSMQGIALTLTRLGVPVLRQKIERIVFDTKTDVNEITPL